MPAPALSTCVDDSWRFPRVGRLFRSRCTLGAGEVTFSPQGEPLRTQLTPCFRRRSGIYPLFPPIPFAPRRGTGGRGGAACLRPSPAIGSRRTGEWREALAIGWRRELATGWAENKEVTCGGVTPTAPAPALIQ